MPKRQSRDCAGRSSDTHPLRHTPVQHSFNSLAGPATAHSLSASRALLVNQSGVGGAH
jgi:hypothetical protein